jgi:phage-related tail protein
MPAFAEGTSFAPGGAALVGEKGPEIVNLPRGSAVIPNIDIPDFISGSNINNNQQDNRSDNRQFIFNNESMGEQDFNGFIEESERMDSRQFRRG